MARLDYSQDEKRHPWLAMLLDSYAVADTGVAVAVKREEKRRDAKLACRKGCDECCKQKDIPLYPHELVGIYWFASEKAATDVRDALRQRLRDHAAGSPCPFLINGSCAVHTVRPVSCRQFNVFAAPCSPDEDPYYTRRGDVLEPIPEYTDRAFAAVAQFYNIGKGVDAQEAVKIIRSQIMNLQTFGWKKLLALINKPAA